MKAIIKNKKTTLRFIRSGIAIVNYTTYERNKRVFSGWVLQYNNGDLEGLPADEYTLESIEDEHKEERKGYQ